MVISLNHRRGSCYLGFIKQINLFDNSNIIFKLHFFSIRRLNLNSIFNFCIIYFNTLPPVKNFFFIFSLFRILSTNNSLIVIIICIGLIKIIIICRKRIINFIKNIFSLFFLLLNIFFF